jgi:hypothetical protein
MHTPMSPRRVINTTDTKNFQKRSSLNIVDVRQMFLRCKSTLRLTYDVNITSIEKDSVPSIIKIFL